MPNSLKDLQNLLHEGNIELSDMHQAMIQMTERKKYLAMQPYEIWQGTDGKYHTYLPGEDGERLHRKRKTKQELEQVIIEYWKTIAEKEYFLDVFDLWVKEKLEMGDIYKQTYDKYCSDAIRFFKDTDFSKIEFHLITTKDLEKFIKKRIVEMKLSSKGYSAMRLIIIGVFRYGYNEDKTNIDIKTFFNNLTLSRKIFTKQDSKPQVFTDEEVSKIEEFIRSREPSVINQAILLGFYTGLRVGEIVALTKDDIDLKNRVIHVTKTEIKFKDGKTVFEVRDNPKSEAGIRDVYMCDEAIQVYKTVLRINPFTEYLFTSSGQRCHGKEITKKLYSICDQLGIPRRSMHKTRKTYATKLINAGVPESIVKNQMGHSDIKTTFEYYYGNNFSTGERNRQIDNAINY